MGIAHPAWHYYWQPGCLIEFILNGRSWYFYQVCAIGIASISGRGRRVLCFWFRCWTPEIDDFSVFAGGGFHGLKIFVFPCAELYSFRKIIVSFDLLVWLSWFLYHLVANESRIVLVYCRYFMLKIDITMTFVVKYLGMQKLVEMAIY